MRVRLTRNLVDQAMVQLFPAADLFVIGDSFHDFGPFALGKGFLEAEPQDEGLVEALAEAGLERNSNGNVDSHGGWWRGRMNRW